MCMPTVTEMLQLKTRAIENDVSYQFPNWPFICKYKHDTSSAS